MSFIECIRLAFGSLRVNKMRSVLTMLGIIIGISSVITITTIGNSLQQTLSSTMNSLGGTNLISCYLEAEYPEDEEEQQTWVYPEMQQEDYISIDMINDYKEAFKGKVDAVIATESMGSATSEQGKNTVNTEVIGSTVGYLKSLNVDLVAGRDISERDTEESRPTAVVSDLFVKYAFGSNTDPIGQQITLSLSNGSAIKVYIVGVYIYDAKKFGTIGQKVSEKNLSTIVITPVSYAQKINNTADGFTNFTLISSKGQDPTQLANETTTYFNNIYEDNEDWKVSCYDMASQLGIINKALAVITIAISAIAGISLIVGGVGVMNIMLVSVMERTHEIGIRKALGAKNKGIRMQFLIEAIVICLVGGLIGITIGIANGFILSKIATGLITAYQPDMASYLTVTVSPSITAIFISVIFSMVTGVVFGYYPANRAAKMSPIDALRYE